MSPKVLSRAILVAIGAACVLASAQLRAQQANFTTGSAVGTSVGTCDPNSVPGDCWGLNITCPNVQSFQPYDATVKITTPAGASIGTIIFITGAGGTTYYDAHFNNGSSLILDVVNAGFTAAQIVFDNPTDGWLTGPAQDSNGPITLACLPAAAIEWVYNSVLTPGTPLCATGNSGGSFAIAYALSHYGLDSVLTLAELTSGPEASRLDYGCSPGKKYSACAVCGTGTQYESFGIQNAENIVDPAYTGVKGQKNASTGPCSLGWAGNTQWAAQLHHDSILSDTYSPLLSFATQIRVVFGGLDTSGGAIPEGLDWASFITSSVAVVCVPGAGHEMANYTTGAAQIESDLITYCRLP